MLPAATTKSRIQQLRSEAKVTSTRRSAPTQKKTGKGFGAAVAFATGSHKKRKNAVIFDLAGGKRLKMPTSKPPARDFKRKMR